MFETLKVRKEALEELLLKKLDELKLLCFKEGELTGELPPETPLNSNERLPQIRQSVGTAPTLINNLLLKPKTKDEEILSKLELEYEIQIKIVSAATQLTKDTTAKKNVRKQRKQSYQQALAKMKDLEAKLLAVKNQIAVSRRQHSSEELNKDNISHSSDESQVMCRNSLNKFFVTERTNKPMNMRRSASLYYNSLPSTPNNLNVDKHSSRVRPLSPLVVSSGNRVDVIQRPRSAAATSVTTFDYDTDEESNEMLKNTDDNISSIGSSGGTNSVILTVNRNHREVQNQNNSHLLRSNSLGNSIRRIRTNQRTNNCQMRTNSPTIASHHTNYANHYPSYQMNRTPEIVPMSPSSVHSYHSAQRPLPNLPVSETKQRFIQSPTNERTISQMSSRTNSFGSDLTDYSSIQRPIYKHFQNNRFNYEEPVLENYPQSPRSVTPSRFSSNTPSIGSQSMYRNVSPYPPPQTPKTPKTWTETSLDFVLPTKPNKMSQNSVNSSTTSSTASNGMPSSGIDFTKELYVNVNPQTQGIPSPPGSPLSVSKLSQSRPTPSVSSPSPQLLSPKSLSPFDRNSIASTTISIGGDSVSSRPPSIPFSPTIPSGKGVEVTVVSVGHFQPYWEEEKPFEIEDFYKYSQKHRNQTSKQQMSSPAPNQTTNNGQESRVKSSAKNESINWYGDRGRTVIDSDNPNATLV